jgi:hypothetical protein
VSPKHKYYSDHVETRQQQIALIGCTIAQKESLNEEEVLQVAKVNQDPCVERFDVDVGIEYVFGVVNQASRKLGYGVELASLEIPVVRQSTELSAYVLTFLRTANDLSSRLSCDPAKSQSIRPR